MDKAGGAVVELLIPFEASGKKVDAVRFKPFVWDYVIRWRTGKFASSFALLAAMTGEAEATLRLIRYPDVNRVMAMMLAILPEDIRNDIDAGESPQADSATEADEESATVDVDGAAADEASRQAAAEAAAAHAAAIAAAAAHNEQFAPPLDDDLNRTE